nr:immunoglobulin light chain junction region [Macaca mulatta]MOW16844.1 immunoglobulin light chain junction region [Macaca mulatta]
DYYCAVWHSSASGFF